MIAKQDHRGEDVAEPLPVVRAAAPPLHKVRGKAAPPYLAKATILANKYRIEKLIGGGGFGQIYRATDINESTVVAVKVEPESEEAGRMVLEQQILAKLNGKKHFPRLYCAGAKSGFNFIVMQLLGRNLTELRKATRAKRLTVHSTVRIGIQMVEALRNVHEAGHLHRDIKPSNICVGIGEHRRIIYLVDFGMTRQFRHSNGRWRRGREYAAFRGTMRYVSIAVHERQEQGPVDDLWSLYYGLIELAEGALPWRTMTDNEEILKMKGRMSYAEMCTYLPRAYSHVQYTLSQCGQTEMPDYAVLTKALQRCCKYVDEDADFEWDDEPRSTQTDG